MYNGPSKKHYRRFKCSFTKKYEVNADTVIFYPHQITFTKVRVDSFFKQVASDMIILLMNPPPYIVPSLQDRDHTKKLLKLLLILNRTNDTPDSLPDQKKTTLTETAQ